MLSWIKREILFWYAWAGAAVMNFLELLRAGKSRGKILNGAHGFISEVIWL